MEAATATAPASTSAHDAGVLDRMRSDARLVERFRHGDDSAFAALYRRHRARVLAVCTGVLGSPDDAQDAAQETFVRAAGALRERAPENVGAWLARVARNAAIDVLRRRQPVADAAACDRMAGAQDDRRAELGELVAALRELPESQRTALVMRELGGYTYAEIGGVLGMHGDAVNGLIARARIGLRAREEAVALGCPDVRERLAAELDGRRRPADLRRHLRACTGCRDFQRGLRGDRRALRAVFPGGGLGLWQLLAGWRATRAAVGGGFVAKGVLGSGAAKLAAVCALCAGAAGGAAPLVSGSSPEHDGIPRGSGAGTASADPAPMPERAVARAPATEAAPRGWSRLAPDFDVTELERRLAGRLHDLRIGFRDGWRRDLDAAGARFSAGLEQLRAYEPRHESPAGWDGPSEHGGGEPAASRYGTRPAHREPAEHESPRAWQERRRTGVQLPGADLPGRLDLPGGWQPSGAPSPRLPAPPELPPLPDPGSLVQLP